MNLRHFYAKWELRKVVKNNQNWKMIGFTDFKLIFYSAQRLPRGLPRGCLTVATRLIGGCPVISTIWLKSSIVWLVYTRVAKNILLHIWVLSCKLNCLFQKLILSQYHFWHGTLFLSYCVGKQIFIDTQGRTLDFTPILLHVTHLKICFKGY